MTPMPWLDAGTPAPPPALARRMHDALDVPLAPRHGPTPDSALDAAMALLDAIVRDDTGSRTGALTLLAADALVTYAFETAGEHPERIESLAVEAMTRIATAAERAR